MVPIGAKREGWDMKKASNVLILNGAGTGERGVITKVYDGYVVVRLGNGKTVRVLDGNYKTSKS